MTRITIFSNDTISIDRRFTGYRVRQTPTGTVVERHAANGAVLPVDLGATITMPSRRYALSCRDCAPLSGAANFNKFESDLLEIWDAAAGGGR
jgi:hypothetical protein